MMWEVVPGKVISVTDGNNILLSIKNNKRLLVHLVGIDAPTLDQPFGRESQRFLQLMVLGKKVNALVNLGNWSFKTPRPKEATGVVELQRSDAKDVNLSLVGAGLARHKDSEPYTMSRYTECQYEKAEEDARAAKRGLWH